MMMMMMMMMMMINRAGRAKVGCARQVSTQQSISAR